MILLIVEASIRHRSAAAPVELRQFGGDVDRACRGILAEQRALRTPQYLYLRNVDQIAGGHTWTAQINAVDEDAGTVFQPVTARIVAHPADRYAGLVAVGDDDIGAGDELVEVLQADVVVAAQVIPADGGDGKRNVAQLLFHLTGSDDDVAARPLLRREGLPKGYLGMGFLGMGWPSMGQSGAQRENACERCEFSNHDPNPLFYNSEIRDERVSLLCDRFVRLNQVRGRQ